MSDLYVRTSCYMSTDEYVNTVTPLDVVNIKSTDNYTVIQIVDEMDSNKHSPYNAAYVRIDELQICVEIDDQLYVWTEWEL